MLNNDSIQLLKECDAGAKMGIDAINDVINHIENQKFRDFLLQAKQEHEQLQKEAEKILLTSHATGKDPNQLAKSMSWIETNMKILLDSTDKTIADLMTDGCNMGIKSLRRYLNEYGNADEVSKEIVERLIQSEHQLILDISVFL
ncbi:MAG: hypothetical protein PUF50_01075 [Erysipelotrichaceae bacterium]|nr:hypothetical protein [Erysipelotrichaceae bacterium]